MEFKIGRNTCVLTKPIYKNNVFICVGLNLEYLTIPI